MLNKMKRILALFMSIMMITSSMPVSALADTATTAVQYNVDGGEKNELDGYVLLDENSGTITMSVGDSKKFYCYSYTAPGNVVSWNHTGIFEVSDSDPIDSNAAGVPGYKFTLTALKAVGETTVPFLQNNGQVKFNISEASNEVSFDANNGTDETATDKAGATYKLPLCTFTEPEGMAFAGWEVDGTVYPAGKEIELTGDITAKATWGEKATVSYANSTYTQAAAKGGVVTLPNYSEAGYAAQENMKFYGWATSADATEAAYAAGDTLTLAGDTTLYPVWGEVKLNITLTVEHYYQVSNSSTNYQTKDFEYKTETFAIDQHTDSYVVSRGNFAGILAYKSNPEPKVVSGLEQGQYTVGAQNGTITFNTQNVALDEYEQGALTVRFYYDPLYTVGYRVDNTTATLEQIPGVKRSFPYEDSIVEVKNGAYDPVEDKVITASQLGSHQLSPSFQGYASPVVKYKNPGDAEFSAYDSNSTVLQPGAQIITFYSHDPNPINIVKFTYSRFYWNEFNSQFAPDTGHWEDFWDDGDPAEIVAHMGQEVTITFAEHAQVKYYERGTCPIGYYKDSSFGIWLYRNSTDNPNGETLSGTQAEPNTVGAGTSFVVKGGIDSGNIGRYWLLYKGLKPIKFDVSYYLDGEEITDEPYTRDSYTPYNEKYGQGDIVTTQKIPAQSNNTVWEVHLYDQHGNLNHTDATGMFNYSDITGAPDDDFKMIDRHVQFHAYTPINVYYVAEEGGSVDHDFDTVNRKSGEPLFGSTATPEADYEFVGWYKGDELVSENATLDKQTAQNNLNYNETKKWYEETTFVAKFRKIPSNKIDIKVEKVWNDCDYSQDRPTSVQVQLRADGVNYGEPVVLNTENLWKYTWSDVETKKADGTEIVYSVAEITAVAGYTTTYSGNATSGFTITNTLNPILVDVTVKKVWEDKGNQDGKRPASLKVTLVKNDQATDTIVTLTAPDWTATIKDQPKYVNNQLVEYTWTEETVDDYTLSKSTSEDGYTTTLTNTHEVEKINVSVEKRWDDANDQDGKRPTSITVQLKANGNNSGDPVTLNATNGWKYTWSNLDKKADGEAITYTVLETSKLPQGYRSDTSDAVTSEDGKTVSYTITNNYTPEVKDVTVTKVWDDDSNRDGVRPEQITLLLKNGDSVVAEAMVNVTEANSLTHTFENVPVYANKVEIEYTVDEADVTGYSKSLDQNTLTITNTHTPEVVSVTATKVWNDNNNQDGLRKDVTLYLNKQVGEAATVVVEDQNKNIAANATGDALKVTWNNLPKFEDGKVIAYTVTEAAMAGYNTTITDDENGNFTVENSHTPEVTSVTATKVWNDNDNQDGKRADVTLHLTKKVGADDAVVVAGQDKTIAVGDALKVTWDNQPKFEGGVEIVYGVTEDALADYSTEITGDAKTGFIVKNTHTPETIDISGTKTWIDADNQDGIRPDSITVRLYADGTEKDSVTVNAASNWGYSFENLPKYAAGKEIKYTIAEDAVEGYTATINNYDITNTHTPEKISVSGIKTWKDNNNQDGKRPTSITVHLLANGEDTGKSAVVTADNGWSYKFENVDKCAGGKEIVYSVSENEVEDYSVTYNGMNITNSYTPDTTNFAGNKVWNDDGNRDCLRPGSITIHLWKTVDGVSSDTGKTVTLTTETSWSFENLPKYEGGKLITYFVQEDAVENYETTYSEDYKTITNTYAPETTTVSGSKTWDDDDNRDKVRPEEIIINLLADGTKVASKTVTVDDNWTWEWTDLPKNKNVDGEKTAIVYTITEEKVANYTTEIAEGSYDVTNTHVTEKTSVTVTKKWEDNGDQDGIRPDSVTINLLADGKETGKSVVLNADNEWTATFADLNKNDQGAAIVYTVEEADVPDTYGVEITGSATAGYTVTNTHTPETTSVSGTKTWIDNNNQDGKRPDSIIVLLKADDKIAGTANVTPNEEGEWKYSFTGLPKYRDQGTLIEYSVEESAVEGYITEIVDFDIKNTHTIEKVSISGTKVWDDADNQDGKRPGSITINLMKAGVEIDEVTVTAEDKWEISFTDLDKYENGKLINYTITEDPVADYASDVSMTWNPEHTVATVTVTNSRGAEKTSATVTKTWDDANDQDGLRPDFITVQLLADGEPVEGKEATITPDVDGVWAYTFTNLPKYADGTEIVYTVEEIKVEGYTTKIDGLAITNSHTPATVNVEGTKTWDDANDQDGLRPDSITVRLYADGEPVDGKVATITAESADADGKWKHSFTGLPMYRNGGTKINYTIREDKVENYTTVIDGFAITNSHIPVTVNVEGTKTWDDANDQDGLRPGSITVQLLADGKVKETKTVTAENEWKYSFTNLPKFKIENNKGGTEIVYTVKEDMDEDTAKAYTSVVTGNNIKNTHTPAVVTVEGTKTWNDESNRDGKRPTEIIINLLADGTVKESKKVTANDGWAWKWENLPKFAAGEEIVYTITEEPVAGYTTEIAEGSYDVTNTHTIETVTVAGKKDWNDFDNVAGLRPENITINLLADGKVIDSKTVTGPDWSWEWKDLPKYEAGKVGDEITYTITESAVGNYTTEVQGYNVKNTYTPGKTSVSVTKVWDDDGNRDGLRPASITVKLLADGDEYRTAELTAPNWSATFEQLPIYKEGEEGKVVAYTVAEDKVTGYNDPVITGNATEGYTITNTHDIATTKVEGTKVWKDENDQDGIRKESVTIRLLADGTPVEGKVATVNEASEWKFSFDNLPVNENGTAITYTVSEDKVDGYEASITGDAATGFTVTNTHTPAETEVSVTKVWKDANDQDGLRPDFITIKLAANGQAVANADVKAVEGWSYKFTKLPKYAGGKEIAYTVEELTVSGYETTEITGTAAGGYTITNTHNPGVTSVSGTKTWDDADNQDGKRPASITVNLLANGEVKETKTVNAETEWKYSFTNLPTHADGEEIAYSVEEDLSEELKDIYTSKVEGYNITNTHQVEKTEVKVTKVWKDTDNQDNKRTASVTINLLANDEATGKSVELNEANGWTYTFENLDKFSKGEEIEYTVEEDTVPTGYTVAVTGDAATGYTVTNTHDIDTTKAEGAKTWKDNDDQDGKRPELITVRLLADDVEIDSATVTADNGWNWSFENLPVNKAGEVGQAIVYTITEDEVEGYTAKADGYNITNTHEIEKVAINGTKEWQDANDQDGLRPDSITINLLKNGEDFKNTTATAKNGWAWSFADLDKYEDGKAIAYSIEEIAVTGYTTTGEELVWNADETAATVALVNEHTPATTEIKVTKSWDDNENQDGKRPANIKVQLLANGTQVDEAIIVDQNGKWEHTFTNLPVKEAGEDITYTITETAVEGYTTKITDFAITNTHEIIKTSVSGKKIWSDAENQDGKRPTSITVNLLANGTEIKETKVAADVNGDWKFSFTDLDAYTGGKLITYTVTEDKVAEYSTEIEADEETGFITITNSYTPGKTRVAGVKVWDDADDQDGLRPDSITVNLVATVESINYRKVAQSATVTADNGWKYSFEDLPTHVAGKEIEYSITEDAVEGYETKVDGYSITNSHTPATTSISGEKFWDDADDQDSKRPASITVNLLADGEKVKSATVTADGNGKWLYTFEDLPVNKAGEAIEYTVTEEPVEGYTAKVDGVTITNTHTPETIKIDGVKSWNDAGNQDGIRPTEITVKLMDGENVVATATATAADGWKYTFTDLPKYREGKEIEYTIAEETVEGYTAEADGFNLINTHAPETIKIDGVKSWEDANNQDGIRPTEITVKLMDGENLVTTTTATEANGWAYSFTDLPKYREGKVGEEIVYTIAEETVEGYTAKADGFDLINTHTPETTSVSGVKTWNDADNQDGKRPESITVNLLVVKGENEFELITSKTVTATDNWEYTFDNLPVYAKGEKITYKVTEVAVTDYTADYEGYNIKNTHNIETVEIAVSKAWNDANNQDKIRPESIVVKVMDGSNEAATVTLTEANDWQYTFTDLPKYREGKEIVYIIDEIEVAGYETTGEALTWNEAKTEATVELVNTHETDKTSISGQKTWDDLNNEKKIRPAAITVMVMNGTTEVARQTVTAENGWKYTFNGLEKNANGQAIKYTIVEEPVDGYTATVTDYNILNKTEVPKISVTKTADVKDGLKVGDVVTYTIVVKNTGNVDLLDVTVDDDQTNLRETIDLLPKGESIDLTTEHTITEADLLAGEYVNTVKAEGTSPEGEKTDAEASERVETEEVDPKLVVTKTADVNENVKVGDTITYTITVKNIGNVTLKNIVVTDDLTGDEWIIDELAVGETSEELTATYVVTEADLLAHKIENIATATAKNPDDPDGEPVKDDDDETVETEEVKPALEVIKTANVTENVKVGDTITYTITVKNIGNVTLKAIEVVDDLTGDEWIIDELGVGETSDKLTATYVVKETDLLAHKIENIATATAKNPDDPDGEPVKDDDDETVKTEEVKPALEVIKTADVTENVKVGDTITYTITVKNIGNVTLKAIEVVDDLTGDEWIIDELGVGETSEELKAEYVVTSDDILKGTIKNIATAETTNPDKPDEPVKDDDDEVVDPEPIDTTLEVIKTSDKDGETVGLDEVITYTISVTNKGNVPFTNVEVVDEMTNDEWTIETLAVGETKEFEATYTVTSDDILKGIVINSVTAAGDPIPDPDPDVPPHIPEDDDDEDDPTDPIDTTLTVVKTSDKQGQKVKLGEKITYTITVTNDGNVPYTNVEVVDELTGDKWTIEELPVGATETFTAEYIVTSDDILAGTVLNSVTAKGDEIPDPDPENPPHIPEGDDDEEDDPEPIDTTLTVVKTSDVTTTAQVGDTITYTIVVKNDGNVDYTNVKVDDELTGLHETIEVLKVGESQTFTTTRIVTAADAAAGHILNVAVAKADPIPDSDDPDQPKVPEGSDDEDDPIDPMPVVPELYRVTVRYWYEYVGGEVAAKTFTQQYATGDPYAITSPKVRGYEPDIYRVTGVMEKQDMVYDVIYTANEYKLTVKYIYLDGSEAAPTYTETLKAGDEYYVESPVIDGYRASTKVVEGRMPARDVKYTVVYVPRGRGYIIIDDYDTPLGIGNVHLNAGECFE